MSIVTKAKPKVCQEFLSFGTDGVKSDDCHEDLSLRFFLAVVVEKIVESRLGIREGSVN